MPRFPPCNLVASQSCKPFVHVDTHFVDLCAQLLCKVRHQRLSKAPPLPFDATGVPFTRPRGRRLVPCYGADRAAGLKSSVARFMFPSVTMRTVSTLTPWGRSTVPTFFMMFQ